MAKLLVVDDDAMNRRLAVTALKVVAFTALAMKGDADRLLAVGFGGYIEKPIR